MMISNFTNIGSTPQPAETQGEAAVQVRRVQPGVRGEEPPGEAHQTHAHQPREASLPLHHLQHHLPDE